MQYNLTLVDLTPEQIQKAKEANGSRKRITHALICGPYGQMFGTERQCLKYFTVWDPDYRIEVAPGKFNAVFPELFDKAVKTTQFEITDYKSTWDLVGKLIEVTEHRPPISNAQSQPDSGIESKAHSPHEPRTKKLSIFSKWVSSLTGRHG